MRVATDDEKIYIQKLIPDLGVFDIAEKYFAEGGTQNEFSLFRKDNMTGLRFMANNYKNAEIIINDEGINGIKYELIKDDIIIFIFDGNASVSITHNTKEDKPEIISYFVRF